MTLPTLLVVLFLWNGQVYSEVAIAPSMEICNKVQQEAKNILVKSLGKEPEAMHTYCVTLKPLATDA